MRSNSPDASDVDELIRYLRDLQIEEARVTTRIQQLRSSDRAGAPPAPPTGTGHSVSIGDRVCFRGTVVTQGGKGIVVGWTRGSDPFAIIQRTDGPFVGSIVRRKPSNIKKTR